MSFPVDHRARVEFLLKLQRLLTEGGFVATYKYALLHAIADLCVEKEPNPDGTLTLGLEQLAVKFIELYWRQARHFPVLQASADFVLKQNTGGQAAVVRTLRELHDPYQSRLPVLKSDARAWSRVTRRVASTIQDMPLWRLQTVGARQVEFLYRNEPGAERITLLPGVAGSFRAFHGLVVELVRAAWIRFVRQHNPAVRDGLELYGFLFGSDRASLRSVLEVLESVEGLRCFYCEQVVARRPQVDHFIPWIRYPNDLGHNFVIAHGSCNARKSDHLAGERHLRHWAERNRERGARLATEFSAAGVDHDLRGSVRVAEWAYEQLEEVRGDAWVEEKRFVPLAPTWRTVIADLRDSLVSSSSGAGGTDAE